MDQTVTLPCLNDRYVRGSGRLVTYTSLRKPAYTAESLEPAVRTHTHTHACSQESVPSELMTFNMVVSVLWAAYNSIPAILLLHFAFAGYKGMRCNVRICSTLASLILLGVLICVWLLLPPSYDFGQVIFSTTRNLFCKSHCYTYLHVMPSLKLSPVPSWPWCEHHIHAFLLMLGPQTAH